MRSNGLPQSRRSRFLKGFGWKPRRTPRLFQALEAGRERLRRKPSAQLGTSGRGRPRTDSGREGPPAFERLSLEPQAKPPASRAENPVGEVPPEAFPPWRFRKGKWPDKLRQGRTSGLERLSLELQAKPPASRAESLVSERPRRKALRFGTSGNGRGRTASGLGGRPALNGAGRTGWPLPYAADAGCDCFT